MWGGAALKAVSAKLAKGWPTGLTVLTGDDLYHLDQAQALILTHLVPEGAGSFALSVVGDESITTGALGRGGALDGDVRVAPRRLPSGHCGLGGRSGAARGVRGARSGGQLSSSFALRSSTGRGSCTRLWPKPGSAWTFASPQTPPGSKSSRPKSERWPRRADSSSTFARSHSSWPPAVRISIASPASSTSSASGKGAIDTGTVRELVAGSVQLSGWELADALTERDAVSALRSARRSLDAGDEPIRMVGGLASRARALLKAKGMIEAGASPQAAVDAARAWYFREGLQKGVKRYTLDELLAMPSRLFEADRTFKSRSLDKGAVLQALVMGLTR